MFEVLFFLAIFLTVVTVVGHVFWLIAAAFLKAIFGSVPDTTQETISNRTKSSEAQRVSEDFDGARRLLVYAKFRQWISKEKFDEVDQLLNTLKGLTLAEPAKAPPEFAKQPTQQASTQSTPQSDSNADSQPAMHTPPFVTPLPSMQFERQSLGAPQAPAVPSSPTQQTASPPARPIATPAPSVQPSASVSPTPSPIAAKHALELEDRPKSVQRPPVSKRLTSDVILAFMQKSNVRWIELISAALIVICSTGLVISLWNTLAATSRFFPALIFCLATVAVHAAGHYTLKQWKLRDTSRGILHIANMLIPLSVMAGLLLSLRPDQTFSIAASSVLAILLGAVVYGTLAIWTSRTLFGPRHWYVSATIIASTFSLLVTHIMWGYHHHSWFGDTLSFVGLLICNCAMVSAFSTSLGHRQMQHRGISQRQHRMSYQILFATIAAMGFYAFRNKSELLQLHVFWLYTFCVLGVWCIYAAYAAISFRSTRSAAVPKAKAFTGAESNRNHKSLNTQTYALMACAFAAFFVPVLGFASWQISEDRILLSIATGSLTAWLVYLLLRTSLPVSRTAITFGVCATSVIVLEGILNGHRAMHTQDWLLLPKVLALICVGSISAAYSTMSKNQWRKPTAIVGMSALILATLLSAITAILQIVGIRVFEVWPEVVMGTIGLSFLVTANVRDIIASRATEDEPESRRHLTTGLAALGVAFFSAFVVHLVQLNPIVDSYVAAMRPVQSIPISLATISVVVSAILLIRQCIPTWRIASNGINYTESFDVNTPQLLAFIAIGTAIGCAVQAWIPMDQFNRILTVGWCLPLSFFALAAIKRNFIHNEVFRAVTGAWVAFAMFHIGHINGWWQNWDPAVAMVVLSLTICVAITMLYAIDRLMLASSEIPRSLPVIEIASLFGAIAIGYHMVQRAGTQLLAALDASATPAIIPQSAGDVTVLILGSITVCVCPILAYLVHGRLKAREGVIVLAGGTTAFISLLLICWLIPAPYNLLALLWMSFLLAITYFLRPSQSGSESAVSHRFNIPASVLLKVGIAGGSITLLLSAIIGFAAAAGTLRSPLIQPLLNDDSISNALRRWLPTLSWTIPLQILLALRWIQYGTAKLVEQIKDSFHWAWLSVLAIWSAFGLTFLGTVNGFQSPFVFLTYAQLLIACISVILLVALAMHRYRSTNAVDVPIVWDWRYNESRFAITASFICSLVLFGVAYALSLGGQGGMNDISVFATRASVVSLVLQMLAIGLLPIQLPKLVIWRRLLLATPLLAVPYLLSAAWEVPFLTPTLDRWLGWNDWLTISAVVLTGMLGHALVTFFYKPLAKIDYRKLCEEQGKHWADTFCVIRQFAYAVLIVTTFIGCAGFANPNQVSIASILLSLTFLLWSFISAKTRWGVASAFTSMISAVGIARWTHYNDPVQVSYAVITGPLVIAWASFLLLPLHRWLERFWNISTAMRDRDRNKRHYWRSIEVLAAYAAPIAFTLLSLVLILENRLIQVDGILVHSISLTLFGYALTIAVWLRHGNVHLLRLCYFAVIPIFTMTLAWIAIRSGFALPMQITFWFLGLALASVTNSAVYRFLFRSPHGIGSRPFRKHLAMLRHPLSVRWMHAATIAFSVLLTAASILIMLTNSDIQLRSLAVLFPLLCATSIAVLPFASSLFAESAAFRPSRIAVLGLLLTAAMMFSIRDLEMIHSTANLIAHQRRFLIAGALACWLYLFVASKRIVSEHWTLLLYRYSWLSFAIAMVCGGLSLVSRFAIWGSPIEQTVLEELLVFAAWIAIAIRCLQYATKPFANEGDATLQYRSASVYGLQLLVLGTGTELYLDHPEFFGGWVADWWPVIVFLISIASLLLGTMTRLDRSAIFGGPTRQLNLLMPLVPLAGVWIANRNHFWQDNQVFGGLMLGAAILYGVQSWVYRAMWLQLVSIACGVISFWCFIFDFEWSRFWQHPQIWLLPPATAALYFIESNRRLFSRSVLTGMRYIVILIAYLSSTADLMLMAFTNSFWMPIILMALSIAGFFAGMFFRISALLICSVVFLFVSMIGMVWHAQRAIDESWPWWVFGIASGVALLFVLGYFEKNRDKLGEYLEKLKAWDADIPA